MDSSRLRRLVAGCLHAWKNYPWIGASCGKCGTTRKSTQFSAFVIFLPHCFADASWTRLWHYVEARWPRGLGRSSPDQAVRVRALAGDTVLCSWASHVTLTVPLPTQEYKWVPANCRGSLTNCGGVTCDGLASHPGGSRNTSSRFMLRKPDNIWHDGSLGSYVDFSILTG